MPTMKEFTVNMEDRPGTLGKLCRALAERSVNIIAFQSYTGEKGKSTVRFVTDNPTAAKAVLQSEHATETEVAGAKLPNRSGVLAGAAAKLGEAKININYAYAGIEPGTNTPVVIFGVPDAGQAARILEQVSAAAA